MSKAKAAKKTGNTEVGDAGKMDVFEQAKKARGEDDNKKQEKDSGKADSRVKQAADLKEKANPNLKAESLLSEARSEARDKNNEKGPSGGAMKVGDKVHTGTMYAGDVTCKSVSNATGEEISYRIVIPKEQPVTEDGLKHAFLTYHPSAMVDKHFEIDVDNETDPNLRTHLEGVPNP